ncbi:MAG: B12-binding domain-containing radical SAM protein [Promethearchaeota archaeon]
MLKNKLNILFLIPGFFYIEEYQRKLYHNDIPLGTLQISSYLKQRGPFKTDIIDLRVESEKEEKLSGNDISPQEFERTFLRIMENNNVQEQDVIGVNCYTSFQYLQTGLIGEIIKKHFPNVIMVVGGYHPSAVPEDFANENSPFDHVIQGEAELPMERILNRLLNKDLSLPREKNTTIITSRELIDVNTLPFPDLELYLTRYPYKNKFKFDLFYSRGCPFQCAFCAENYEFRSYFFKKFKEYFQNLHGIVEEYNPKLLKIAFSDQSFDKIAIRDKILDYILQNELQDRFFFSCQCRVETIGKNLSLLKKFRKCNMIIGFGFESAHEALLKEMHKTEHPREYIRMMEKILKEYKDESGIHCRLNLLCGFPGENRDTFKKTLNFVEQHALHENIQLSPTLFSNYPNVHVYQNMAYYEQKFGTKFIREWWKIKSNPLKNSVPEKPSKNYSKKELISNYKDSYAPLLTLFPKLPKWSLIIWKKFYDKWLREL